MRRTFARLTGNAAFARLAAAAFATSATTAAPAATPAAVALTVAVATRRFSNRFGRLADLFDMAVVDFGFVLVLVFRFGFLVDFFFGFRLGGGVENVFIRVERRQNRRRRGSQSPGGFDGMHLLATVDDVGHLRVHGRIAEMVMVMRKRSSRARR
ncbi:MAG: hypothetical protein WDN48_07965 [Pseudolabrys sp.]